MSSENYEVCDDFEGAMEGIEDQGKFNLTVLV